MPFSVLLAVLRRGQGQPGNAGAQVVAEGPVEPGWQRAWWIYLLLLMGMVELKGWRMLLLPPLIVLPHERFAIPDS